MTDEEVIIKAEELGFKFKKHLDSFYWTVTAPDGERCVKEQGDSLGMAWVREKITHFM